MAAGGQLNAPNRTRVVYRFGVFELDSETRELRKQGIRVRLSGQPFQVLLLAVDRQGECISREELRGALWPNDSWGDLDLRLNKVVNRVREVLGDSAENPRFLETLPRVGYRFIFPVQRTELAPVRPPEMRIAEPSVPAPVKRTGARKVALLGVAGVLLAVLAILGLVRAPEVVLDPEPLTTYLGVETNPTFSPDGDQVAFAWNGEMQDNFDIYTLRRSDGKLRRLTEAPERDFAPSWSRDGRQIAFLRERAREIADVMVAPAAGGSPRRLTQIAWPSVSPDLDWSADSRWLAVPDSGGGTQSSIFLVSADTGERRKLTSPPADSRGDCFPAFSAGGRRLAFTRFVAGQWNDLFTLAIGPDLQPQGQPVRISSLEMQVGRLAWLSGDRELVFAAGGWGDQRFLYRMEARPGAEARSLGGVRIPGTQPAYSSSTGALAFVHRGAQTSIWEAEGPQAEPRRQPHPFRRLIASTASDLQPDFSPDGSSIVFASNRQRSMEIWVAGADGTDVRLLVSFKENGASAPRWSPDGKEVAFESRRGGQSDIYLYSVADGSTRNLTKHPAEDVLPSWSADGRFVYFCSSRTGSTEIWKAPRAAGPAVRVTDKGGIYAIESPGGEYLYYTSGSLASGTVLRRRSLKNGREREIAGPLMSLPGFCVTAEGVLYLTGSGAEADSLRYFDASSETTRELAHLPKPATNGLSVSRDGRRVLLALREQQGSDLTLLRNVW
jgi:Tol biopolymer transport system component/DNA-binding winged helix-turn-helix (wHTH) protein